MSYFVHQMGANDRLASIEPLI